MSIMPRPHYLEGAILLVIIIVSALILLDIMQSYSDPNLEEETCHDAQKAGYVDAINGLPPEEFDNQFKPCYDQGYQRGLESLERDNLNQEGKR